MQSVKPTSTRIIEARAKAKREGWLRWIRQGEGEEADERAILNGCWFDERRADHWLGFADQFGTLTEGAFNGQPFRLLNWQATDTSRLFGWQRFSPEWGYNVRRFRFWYEEVSKKNGKTPLLALIGNYLLFADCMSHDGLQRQINLFLAATTKKQAERCLVHAIRQINNNDQLREEATIRKLEGFQSVQYLENHWTVVAANPESADGVNGHCLADEFHRWKGFEFFHSLLWMLASQPEGIFGSITTAGEDGENVCKYTHDHARDVNAGRIIDEQFLGIIYAADKLDDPNEEATWFKANPSLGTTADAPIKLSTFRADYEAAKADPSQWSTFKRLRLGLWNCSTNGWLDTACPRGIDDWDSGPTERKTRLKTSGSRIDCYDAFTDEDLLKIIKSNARDDDGETITTTLAMDLAAVRDTVAAVLTVQDKEQLLWTRPWFWLPKAEAQRQRKRINYQAWADMGAIKLTEGEVIDYRALLNDLIDIFEKFRIQRFYYDPLFQAEWLTQELESNTSAERVQFPQQFIHYAPMVAEAERRILSKTIRHNGNPVLTWQMANAIAQENANGGKRITKIKRGSIKKVDGVQALLMSLRDSVRAEEYQDDDDIIDI